MKHTFFFTTALALLIALWFSSCSGPNSNGAKSNSQNISDPPLEEPQPDTPPSASGDPASPEITEPAFDASVGSEEIPEDPAELRKRALAELAAGNEDHAITMIDVLLILDPADLELLEIRGDVMMRQGLVEDATVDLRRCCQEGRRSCCR